MRYLTSKDWWERAGVRALKTFCQTAIGIVGTTALISSVDWLTVLSGAAMSAVLSMFTSLAGIPEVNDDKTKTK